MSHIKKTVLRDVLSRLEGINIISNNTYSFYVRKINSDKNKKILEKDLDDLKKVFKLPTPSKIKKTKKYCSSLLLHMAKQSDCEINKSTKYYRVHKEKNNELLGEAEKDSFESTSGFYKIDNLY